MTHSVDEPDPIEIPFTPEMVTAILIDAAPNWEYVQNFRQEAVIFDTGLTHACFFAESKVTGERIYGFVEDVRAFRYVDPDNPTNIDTSLPKKITSEEDPRLLP